MTVWVVIEDTGTPSAVDGWRLIGVFSSLERAQAAADAGFEHPEWTSVISVEVE